MNNKYFKLDDTLYSITSKYPFAIDLFTTIGFENMKDEKVRETLGKNITLRQALSLKKISELIFSERLEEIIKENLKEVDSALVKKEENLMADIKIQGLLPCPVRIPLLEGFNNFLDKENIETDNLQVELQSASMGVDFIKDKVLGAENEDELADIFISAGFDLFFDKKLMGKFKDRKVFKDMTNFTTFNKDFENDEISLRDPDGEYSMLSVAAAVFLVNKEELKGMEMPTSFEDILKEEYENRVSLPIGDFDLFNAILLNIYKKYGEEGIRKLGKSLFKGMHPSEMLKSHIKKGEKPLVTIMPYFFTKMTKKEGPMVAVWPKDGAIISPIFMLTKRSKEEKLKPFVDFFASKAVGEILSHKGGFPSTSPEVDNEMPKENKYMWLGWDYIKNNDIASLITFCEKIFNDETGGK